MATVAADIWWRRGLRQMGAPALRALPIPQGQKWAAAGKAADLIESAASPHKVVHMVEGFKMRVDLRESYERRMYYSGVYNPYLTRLFKRILKPGDTVVDGGANIGYFSLLAARCVGARGQVHAFEPIPQTFETLAYNVRLNALSTVQTNRLALSSCSGELHFEVPVEEQAGNGLGLGRLASIALRGSGMQVVAQAGTLDEYSRRAGIDFIKLVKLDIEGSESAAIEGMRCLLQEQRIAYLICEQNTPLLDALGIAPATMRCALQTYGYGCYFISTYIGPGRTERLELVESSSMPAPDIYGDYLFVAPGMPLPAKKQA